jgi:hypothetical protein
MKLFSTKNIAAFVSALIPFLLTDAGNPWPKEQMDKPYSSAASSVVAEKKLLSFSNSRVAVTGRDDIKKLTAGIEAREYDIQFDAFRQQYQSPNRKHNIRSYYKPGQWNLQSRTQQDGQSWQLTLVTEGVYADGQRIATPDAASKKNVHENQLDFVHGGFTEQYINNTEGIRQNFIVTTAPPQSKTLAVRLKYDGMQAGEKANNIITFSKANTTLSYADIKAWDAAGKSIAASMQLNKNDHSIALIASVDNAVFPVTIDPIIRQKNNLPDAVLPADVPYTYLGSDIEGIGDINGDGYGDVIAGTWETGTAFIYYGSADGISKSNVDTLKDDWFGFGMTVSAAGDINADGYADFVIGANYNDMAIVFYGSVSGINTDEVDTLQSVNTGIGMAKCTGSDVNGDGYNDIIIGAPYYSNGESEEGAVFVFYGSATGVNTTPVTIIESNIASLSVGRVLAPAGDVNNDGYDDFLVGLPMYTKGESNEGIVLVFSGSAAGVITTSVDTLESNQVDAAFGTSIAGAGDLNGDGFTDIIIGAPRYDNGEADEGIALIYHGSATGIDKSLADTLQNNVAGALFGSMVISNKKNNSLAEIAVAPGNYDNAASVIGIALVYSGSASGINLNKADTLKIKKTDINGGNYTFSFAGDINGDGYSDVAIAAPEYSQFEQNEGAVFVYYGKQNDSGNTIDNILEGNQSNASYGASISGAGDVNGDGYSDLLIGAPLYDNGETDEGVAFLYYGSSTGIQTAALMLEVNQAGARFGTGVSGAGDVNGDGYGDLIVGAPLYDKGQTDEGAAFLFLGSAAGLISTPAVTLESNQVNAAFGTSVSRAGDINGDGFSDIIIGASLYDNGQADEGAAFIYAGSASGVNLTPASVLESNQASAAFGTSVSGAGDVNGDGYSDLVVGAPSYTNGESNEGVAFVYHGSAGGIVPPAAIIIEANQADADFGYTVSGAGDVNGDGYSDVIVGAFNYDNGETDEGAAFVYYGSAAGVTANPPAVLECNKENAQFAKRVSGVGDMNGDGYSDVVVGSPEFSGSESVGGAAFVYYGAKEGVNATAIAVLEINRATALFGSAVSAAGDVNGDGYADLIVGATGYTNAGSNEGGAFLYQGAASVPSLVPKDSIESIQPDDAFGSISASAGDVNGDGYDDVIVHASQKVYVYHGSIDGLSHVPNITLFVDQSFGAGISSAGDVNGDGYGDIVIGAPNRVYGTFNDLVGMAFIYYGSATGINPALIDTLESGDSFYDSYRSNFGATVSGAGDTNGDGYGDIIIGAWYGGGSGSGYARVFYGSASGINKSKTSGLGGDCKGLFASSVSAAGDVNGDGFGDIVIGAPVAGTCLVSQPYGAIHIYYGSDTGISYLNETGIYGIENVYSGLGSTVTTVGDVNGDGFSDVAAGTGISYNGQGNSAASIIYYGSSSGIYANTVSILTPSAGVSSAGDINGDGYGDVISGTSLYLGSPEGVARNSVLASIAGKTVGDINGDGFSDVVKGGVGKFYIYYGNNGGLQRNIRLFNSSTTIPIQQNNITQSNFAIGVFAKNPQGTTKGKLVWETRNEGQPFSSNSPITNSTQFTAQQAVFTDLGTAGIQLTDNISKTGFQTKVRARIKYDAATSLTGQVYSPWLYPQGLFGAMGMNAAALPVELLDFTAVVVENKKVQLDWQTASESNNAFFTVEKSIDAQQWKAITKVKGAGNSSVTKWYQVFDDDPYTGVSYYRLKQTDNDGRFVYSETRKVAITVSQSSVRIYPNPATNTITIEGNKKELATMVIFNGSGQNITGAVHVRMITDTKAMIDISKVSSGIYYLKTATTTGKIFKR